MMPPKEENTITFTLILGDSAQAISTFVNEHHSLMSLISDRLSLPGFGLCCGMGSCGECSVRIQKQGEHAGIFVSSCQIAINESLNHAVITVLSGY